MSTTLPVFDLASPAGRDAFARQLDDLRASASASGGPGAAVAAILDDVRQHGDEAVVRYMRQWTDPGFTADRIVVRPEELTAALAKLDAPMRRVLETSIENVRTYQRHLRPADPPPITVGGAELGLRFTPVASVGLAVPGGRAAYPSTVIMLAAPAQAAGVGADAISVVTPPPTRRGDEPVADVASLVLATCALLGVTRVYRIGGAQAIAALAYGTKSVKPVDMIVGPGNVYTQLAKQQVAGRVGIDGFYGPSEIVTIADATADPARVASDLIAQAEHDPGRCYLVAWSAAVIEKIVAQIATQLGERKRRPAIEKALLEGSAALLVADEAQAASVADAIAAEHVNLAVADPQLWLGRLRNGGEFFLGDATPVAAGDYVAGPSHCLPTGTTARFASGISVYTFLKRSGTVWYRNGMDRATIDAIATFATAEGLDGHAASARTREKR
ncbi:MAG: histidinol dehydrogenase [Planctomycetota bacterium]|nr:histidinol dehydrogenase [Planctomycetota bacterium]